MSISEFAVQNEISLGPAEGIPIGQGRAYVVADRAIAVFRQRDGRLFATQHDCPHRGGPLADGVIGAGKVICPLHAWKFDLSTGAALSGSARLKTYPVREEGGLIILTLE